MAEAKSSQKSSISNVLQQLIEELASQSKEESKVRKKNDQVKWMMPPKKGWSGDIFKWQEMHHPFDSDKPNKELVKAVSNPKDPGNVGDLVNTNSQIEYLAMLERAFRARHTMSFPRGIAHASGRRHGQGGDKGPLKFSVLKYLEELQKMSAGSV
jgi:hypothetical protein